MGEKGENRESYLKEDDYSLEREKERDMTNEQNFRDKELTKNNIFHIRFVIAGSKEHL